jgi:hypothetical protein
MKKIISIIIAVITSICLLPWLNPEIKIQWTIYLGIPLIILAGSTGIAFVTKKIEAVIGGMIFAAISPEMINLLSSLL